MDQGTLGALVTGSGGALVVLLAWIYAIAQGENSMIGMSPAYVVKASNERNRLLEEENTELNKAVISLSIQNAGMEAKLSFLSAEVETLRIELKRFREDLSDGTA